MNEQEQAERHKQLNFGIREDGTVDGYVVETYAATIYAMIAPDQYGYEVNFENKYIAFAIDDGGVDQEVRLPFELVAQMKEWIDDGSKKDSDEEQP